MSRLRRQSAPGRGELLEAIESCLVQGDLFGKGRAIAAAAQTVLVGKRRGRLPAGTPRSGLAVQIEATVARLKLPGPESVDDEPRELRLDPLRSRLDRARAVLFRRLNLTGIQYAQRVDVQAIGNRENLTEVWQVRWTHATTATVETAGIYGVTLVQASEAAVRRLQHPGAADSEESHPDSRHPATMLARLAASAECGLATTVNAILAQLSGAFLHTASAANLIEAAATIGRISAGHIPGLPLEEDDAAEPDVARFEAPAALLNARPLVEAALRGLDGLRGSEEPADVIAVVDLTAMIRGDLSAEQQGVTVHGDCPNFRGGDDVALKKELYRRETGTVPFGRKGTGTFFGFGASTQGDDQTGRKMSQSPAALATLLPALKSRLVRLRRAGSPRMQGAAWAPWP